MTVELLNSYVKPNITSGYNSLNIQIFMLEDFSANSSDTYLRYCFLDEIWIVAKKENSNDTGKHC